MADIQYQRLTRGRPRGLFTIALRSRTSLSLGPDHLLFVDSNGYSETYKRFYFRDIQAFIMQRTNGFAINFGLLAVPFVLFLAFGAVDTDRVVSLCFYVIASVFAIIGVIHVLRGQTCRCYLRTAVQLEQLPPLSRVRKAQTVFARLRPLIAAAQGGELSPEAIADRMREHVQPAAPVATPTSVELSDQPAAPPASGA